MSTFFTIPSSPSVRPVEGSFNPCNAARIASELANQVLLGKGRKYMLAWPTSVKASA